jgi:von Willebrand factor type A C-terminal domain
MLAARVSLIARTASGPQTLGHGLVRAIWTDDEALSTQISPHVAHYTGQAELAQAIQDGLQALRMGDAGTAVAELGRAVQLAHQSGNQQTAKLLAKVVDVIDPATGTVRLKPKVADTYEGGQRCATKRSSCSPRKHPATSSGQPRIQIRRR